ncbi:MAG TPA: PQQ-binding-like beta-propeller repeat protein, partial [Methylovirgula sp.]
MKCRRVISICAGIAGAWLYAGAGFAEDASTLAKNPNLWPAPGRDLALTRHSELNQINTKNISHLQLAWDQSTGALRGHEGQSLVVDVDGTPMMYIFSAWPNIVQALDLSDPDYPKEVWNYVKKTDRDESAVPRACCDTVNRGGSYADGKVVYLTLDGWLIALDAKTGKEAWVVKNNYPDKGEDGTPAPLIADGKVFVGFGGDEFAARGSFSAYDLKTGKLVWKKYSTGSDVDVGITADTNKDNQRHSHTAGDLGIHTFPEDNNYKIGGGAAWGWYSYDPELKYIYYGTGNPGLWSPGYRCGEKPLTQAGCNSGKWDNKWSLTIFARKADTGEAVWAYQ